MRNYVVGVGVTAFIPVPELGLTAEVRSALKLPGGGLWVDEPQRALAFGVLYFGLSGIGEALGWARDEKLLRRMSADPTQDRHEHEDVV